MAIPISNVSSTTDTFLDWLDKTNQLLDNLSTKIVTTEANTTGAITVGNTYINGSVSANVFAAAQGLRGGNVQFSNTLFITSNTAFTNSTGNVFVLTTNATTSTLTANIVTVNLHSTNTNISGGLLKLSSNLQSNSNTFVLTTNTFAVNTTTANLTSDTFGIVANTSVTGTLSGGNTTITGFANISGTAQVGANLSVNSTALFVDATNNRVAINSSDTSNTSLRLYVNGNTQISANLYVNNRLEANTLSVSILEANTISFTGSANGSLVPSANITYTLGNSSFRWLTLFTSGINATGDVSVGGNTTVTGALGAGNTTVSGTLGAGNTTISGTLGAGNTTVTGLVTSNTLSVTNTANVGTSIGVGANVSLETGRLLIGNSSVNAVVNSSSLVIGAITVNSTQITAANLTVSGNLTVTGTTTYVNTTQLDVGDNIIVLNADVTGATAPTENAGITVNRGSSANVSFVWDEGADRWTLNDLTASGNVAAGLLLVGANVSVNATSYFVGNSTANSVLSNDQLKVGNTTVNTSINPAVINVGANASVNATAFKIGNTTSNSVLTTTELIIQSNSSTNSTLSSTNLTIANVTATNLSGNGNSITSLNASNLSTGTVPTARLGSGTANTSTFLRGDQSYAVVDTTVNLGASSNSTTFTVTNNKGSNSVITAANSSAAGAMTAADRTKLDGIAAGAQPGTVTSVATGTGLTGGTFTTSGTISLTGQALAIHNLASSGMVARTAADTFAARSVAAGTGVTVSNGNGVSGDPTVGLTGQALALHNLATNGIIARTGSGTVSARTITGGTGVTVTDGDGATNNPSISIGQDVGTSASPTFANIYATGDVISGYTSDKRLKTNIEEIGDSLNKINQVRGITFDWTEEARKKLGDRGGREAGVLAQELQEVLPEVVIERDDGYLAVRYEKIVPLLIEAIKELSKKVDDLTDQLNKNGTKS